MPLWLPAKTKTEWVKMARVITNFFIRLPIKLTIDAFVTKIPAISFRLHRLEIFFLLILAC
jgi:hypothetical protein